MSKATLLAAKKPHKCQRCGGLAPYEEGVYKCMSCGYEEVDRHVFYEFIEVNKSEILEDTKVLGTVKTRKKWQIPKDVWAVVIRRWGLKKVWAVPPATNGLPKLPAWRNDWPPELKVKWLETYQLYLEIINKK